MSLSTVGRGLATVTVAAAGLTTLSATPALAGSSDWISGKIAYTHSRTAVSSQAEGRAVLHIYWKGNRAAIKGYVKNTDSTHSTYAYMWIRYKVYKNGKWTWRKWDKVAKATPAAGTTKLSIRHGRYPTKYIQIQVCMQGLPGSGYGGKCDGDWR